MSLKSHLNSDEICDHLLSTSPSPEELDVEMIIEMFSGLTAELCWIDLSSLDLSNKENHIESKSKQNKYNKMNPEECPPILVDSSNHVIDGRHRVRAFKHRGLDKIQCYKVSG